MNSINTRVLSPHSEGISEAARILADGGLVSFPTETVYGLFANATDDTAVARIYEAKGRPSFNPLIVHVPDVDAAKKYVEFNEDAERLAAAFWPGAITLVLPLKAEAGISKLVTAGLSTLAVRVPHGDAAQAVLRESGLPLSGPSANPSGRVSPTSAQHVISGLSGRIEAVVDGGTCAVGVESTIIGCVGEPTLLRAGGTPVEVIEDCLGRKLGVAGEAIVAPGQLASHYAPQGAVRLNATDKRDGETLLAFGDVAGADLNLSPSGDLVEAAANLFACLHQLDAMNAENIAVSPIPERGLGQAINDRLRRAAAPR
ncbi:L-threonylcarbamoyladenylate synthase [Marivivens aquimaris]|uniref:L-threonylcarbamoyladenylate synthase n=1 Tax=Marivivens aquimaris TaxID=2774876 RepID=UPI0018806728|nr:L-threonylcarbamoyladenylate synthase [Marivivens aquimaris]